MEKYQRHTPADKAEWARLYQEGMTVQEIAEHLDVKSSTVKRYLLLAGVRVRSSGGRRKIHVGMTATEIGRRWQLKKKYGLTVEQWEKMYEDQDGRCVICGTQFDLTIWSRKGPRRSPSVDHCHRTNKVRALLCNRCNIAIGQFEDNPDLFDRAAAYLRSHQENP